MTSRQASLCSLEGSEDCVTMDVAVSAKDDVVWVLANEISSVVFLETVTVTGNNAWQEVQGTSAMSVTALVTQIFLMLASDQLTDF